MCRFDFTKKEVEDIKSKIYFDEEEEEKVFEMKLLNYSIASIAIELKASEPTVSRIIRRVKNKIKKAL